MAVNQDFLAQAESLNWQETVTKKMAHIYWNICQRRHDSWSLSFPFGASRLLVENALRIEDVRSFLFLLTR